MGEIDEAAAPLLIYTNSALCRAASWCDRPRGWRLELRHPLPKLTSGGAEESTKSPGRVRGSPYTISAEEMALSSFGVALSPNRRRRP
jgi:hypothetical protein